LNENKFIGKNFPAVVARIGDNSAGSISVNGGIASNGSGVSRAFGNVGGSINAKSMDGNSDDDNDKSYCSGIIEAVGALNGYRAYRFSTDLGNNRQDASDGVFISNRVYSIGTKIRFRLNGSSEPPPLNTVWARTPVRDSDLCRVLLGETWGKHQGYIGLGIPFVINNGATSR